MFGTLPGSFLIAQMVAIEMSMCFEQYSDDSPLTSYNGTLSEKDFICAPVTFNKSSGLIIATYTDSVVVGREKTEIRLYLR